MSEIPLADLVAFMKEELANREESYPLRVEMGRMTRAEAEKGLARTRAVLETLMICSPNVENAPAAPKIEVQRVTLKHHREIVSELEKRLEQSEETRKRSMDMKVAGLWPIMVQVKKCAKEHASDCIHCASTANVLEEAMS